MIPQANACASRLLAERTQDVDRFIHAAWIPLDGVAVVAVGGYGRAELFPYSDIDLLFVSARSDLKEHLAAFLRALWDHGLRVSHSVHTVEECLDVDERNIELSVSLLDRRFLLGDRAAFDRLRDPHRERLAPALAKLTRDRHAKFHNTIFHLEPNVKEAPGTLRDLQVVRWFSRLDRIGASPPPHDLLFEIRLRLHEAARRDQNVLSFLMQDECAAKLGFADAEGLMRAYYREATPLYRAAVRRVDEAEAKRSPLFAALRDRAARLSNADFSVIAGRVYFRIPSTGPRVLGALFEFVARHGLPLARDTEDRVAQLDQPFLSWRTLRAILDLPFAAQALRAMHATGFLVKLFPELCGVESLVIRDFYHRYTVDEHTLVAIETAEKLRREKGRFADLARETPDIGLVLLALLFHDSGKGEPTTEDHAQTSVEIASRALAALAAPARDRDAILFLIGQHLAMSRLMLTRDLSDSATAATLAKAVGTIEQLKQLTLLTYADVTAVNPDALTPWRATLLWQLYAATERHFTRALKNETAAEGMPTRYAMTHSPEEIAEHKRMALEGRMVRLDRDGNAYRMTVVAPDRAFLIAHVAGALASFGMNILRAEAFSNERHVATETFTFDDPTRTLELNPTERDRLTERVRSAILGEVEVEKLLKAREGPRRSAAAPAELTRITFDLSASPSATLFEVTTEDRPGLLFALAQQFSRDGCNIDVVLVDTQGRKAIDVFYVTKQGAPLTVAQAIHLRESLQQTLAV